MIELLEMSKAIESGYRKRAAELLAAYPWMAGPIRNEQSPMICAFYSRRSMIRWLLKQGVSPDQTDSAGGTVLMGAAANGKLLVVKALIAAGADVNRCNDSGETAFSYACSHNQFAAAKLLFQAGADVNRVVDANGGTAMDWAGCWASWPFYEWLQSVGACHADGTPRIPGSRPPLGKA